jgi:hypothetical protein
VGADVLGVGFDPVNSPIRMEDPLAAAARVAPYTGFVHFDDATFTAAGNGFHRWLCPAGEGVLDWPALSRTVLDSSPDASFRVDLHKGQFAIDPSDPDLWTVQPDLTRAELATVLGLAAAGDARWSERQEWLAACQTDRPARLTQAVAHLTKVLDLSG